MGKIIFLASLLLIASMTFGSNEQELDSQIDKVTVFLQQAQVSRSAIYKLPAGQHELVIEGVSPFIQPNSLQVRVKGSVTILDAKHQLRYPEPIAPQNKPLPPKIIQEINQLQDTLKEVNYVLTELNNKKSVLDMERNMLLSNKIMKGEGSSDTIPVLKDAMAFFREKMNDIYEQLGKLQRDLDESNGHNAKLHARITELQQYNQLTAKPENNGQPIHQLRVTVINKAPASGTLMCDYMVSNARWEPSYDIRTGGAGDPVKLTCKAKIFQSTGNDWNKVPMTLSTNNPVQSQQPPVLPPWYLRYQTYVQRGVMNGDLSTANKVTSLEEVTIAGSRDDYASEPIPEEDLEFLDMSPPTVAAYSEISRTFANIEYAIDLPYEIASDGLEHLIMVQEEELTAEFIHKIVPRLDKESYVMARLSGLSDLDIVTANANIFYDGTYIGQVLIDPMVMNDTLELPLGRDRRVFAEWEMTEEKHKDQVLGGNRFHTEKFEISVRNHSGGEINLLVADHMPVAVDRDIKVELLEGTPDKRDEQTGILNWELRLAKGARHDLSYKWEVKYDKDKSLGMN